ncbi:MAG TPA: TPM domain-containing protein [Burkholderiaceae bacterium]|nr:TPM domain-containing protein [Burkholderiaceae bacterium]
MFKQWLRILKHLWKDDADARRAVPPEILERLTRRVAASEQRHTGEVRICVEAGLPWSYLLRGASARERALTLFGKMRVWDTEHNNGVLIYLLLADHAIELIADRGLNRHVLPAQWKEMVTRLGAAFHDGRFEDGLTQALEEVSAVLVTHYPIAQGEMRHNEQPDAPTLQ